MRKIIHDFRNKTTIVAHRGHEVPIDHEDTAFNYQVWTMVVLTIASMVLIGWAMHPAPDLAYMIPDAAAIITSYYISKVVYVELMYRNIRRFCSESFKLNSTEAFF
jgi:hypothetical protein